MRLARKHSLPTRLFHWINAPVLAVMIGSGLLIYWAHRAYEIRLGGLVAFRFFPDAFYQNRLWRLDHRLAEGMSWHFAFMWIFALNGGLYVLYTLASGEWRELVPGPRHFRDAWQVVLHDLGLRRELPPQGKFNGAQRFAYTGVVLMGAGSLLTGLAIYRPTQLSWLTTALGGYQAARQEHFVLTLGYVGFFLIHIAQVVRAGWNNFRAMVIGVEVAPDHGHERIARESRPDGAPEPARPDAVA